jgi:UDP-glucuronate 4-epimerase
MKVLVTGAAGFIGMHLAKHLIERGHTVVGIDGLCVGYYEVDLKYERLKNLGVDPTQIGYDYVSYSTKYPQSFKFIKLNLQDENGLNSLFKREKFDLVINLAGFANVRYSIDHPEPYISSNILGFLRILQASKINSTQHLMFASTSAIKSTNIYSSSKRMNELMSQTYSYLFGLPITGLRLNTVYGPWCRPDMAIFKFTKAILEGTPLDVYGNGKMSREFIYIDDVLDVIDHFITLPSLNKVPYQLFNIGWEEPCGLMEFINMIEIATEKKAIINYLPMQLGDLDHTEINTSFEIPNFKHPSKITIKEGVGRFVDWYRSFYKI